MNVLAFPFRRIRRPATINLAIAKENATAAVIVDIYKSRPEREVNLAVDEALQALRNGGDFVDAMNAAEAVMGPLSLSYRPSTESERQSAEFKYNVVRHARYQRERRKHIENWVRIAAELIRDQLRGYDAIDIEQAIERARRKLQENRPLGDAVREALAPFPGAQCAP